MVVRSRWIVLLLLAGCYATMEQRWEAFDADRRAEIGVKTKDDYVSEWGTPSKAARRAGERH